MERCGSRMGLGDDRNTAVAEPATKRQTACGHSNHRFLRSISSAPTSSKAHTNLKTSRDVKGTSSHGPPVGAHAHTPTAPRSSTTGGFRLQVHQSRSNITSSRASSPPPLWVVPHCGACALLPTPALSVVSAAVACGK